MVLTSDGKSEHILRTHEGKYNFSGEKIRALTFIDIIKCLTNALRIRETRALDKTRQTLYEKIIKPWIN